MPHGQNEPARKQPPVRAKLRQEIHRRAGSAANVIITSHAKQRMAERGVDIAEILETLLSGMVTEEAERTEHNDGLEVCIKKRVANDHYMVSATIVIDEPSEALIIKTVYRREI
jgi:hypothetical protein